LEILRGSRLQPQPLDVASFTSSVASDTWLIQAVIRINQAHVLMLFEQGLLNAHEASSLLKALEEVPPDLPLDPSLEDVHMNVELFVTKKLGEEVGGKLHLAKSRNDQVATAIRMVLREQLLGIVEKTISLVETLLKRAEEHLNTPMPGYTHLQHAQPVTLAHYLLAYADSFTRSSERLMDSYRRVNRCPMGAAALATTSFKLDRFRVAELLGFEGLIENSMDAVSARDFAVEVLAGMAVLMTDLSRLCEELILWSTAEFGFVDIPDEYASTSSIMPHKKNPVVAELIRAKAGTVYGSLMAALSILKALPMSYNLDLQELTPHLWEACRNTSSSVSMAVGMLKSIRFNVKRLREVLNRSQVEATELANLLVRSLGIPFRQAHKAVGSLVRYAESKSTLIKDLPLNEVKDVLSRELNRPVKLDDELVKVLNPEFNLDLYRVTGGPAPVEVRRMLDQRVRVLSDLSATVKSKRSHISDSLAKLKSLVNSLTSAP